MDGAVWREAEPTLVQRVLGGAVQVHRVLGPGLLESAYQAALCCELCALGIDFERQVEVPLRYRDVRLPTAFRADLIVEGRLLLELKCVERIEARHIAQVLTYLRLLQLRRGFLLNFHHPTMREGIKRVSI